MSVRYIRGVVGTNDDGRKEINLRAIEGYNSIRIAIANESCFISTEAARSFASSLLQLVARQEKAAKAQPKAGAQ